MLVCYDAATGKLLWQKSVPGAKGRTHHKSSLASSTPCSDGERVYIAYWDGESVPLHAYTLDGKPVWNKPLGKFKGGALLQVKLERVHTNWGSYPVSTSSIERAEKGKGRRTAILAGGGAGFGAIIGALAGGG